MSLPPRAMPRFIPTLTDVVPDEAVAPVMAPAPPPAAAPQPAVAPVAQHLAEGVPAQETPVPPLTAALEELVLHRVLQRMDRVLEQRLQDAIATVVQEQTRAVLPRLREEMEAALRLVVCEAVADELTYGEVALAKR